MKLRRVTSRKHRGAVFFKIDRTERDFVAKFYPGNDEIAKLFQEFMEGRIATPCLCSDGSLQTAELLGHTLACPASPYYRTMS